jgi:dTMP kinase
MEDQELFAALAGRFIVFEGPDGSGKSTQFHRLAASCRDIGVVVEEVREPGGTDVGEKIRSALLEHSDEEMSLRCEMLLYMASRAQLVEQKIGPALARGELVLADRFVSSTYAYQGTAGGLPIGDIEAVTEIVLRDVRPELVVVFDVDEATASKRINPLMDRMEAKGSDFHRRVRQGYHELADRFPESHVIVDARGDEEQVWAGLIDRLKNWIGARA